MRLRHTNHAFRLQSLYAIALTGALSLGWLTAAIADIPHGKLRGYIRSSGHPCAHVIESQQVGEKKDGTTVLEVRCNSGLFKVTTKDGVPQ